MWMLALLFACGPEPVDLVFPVDVDTHADEIEAIATGNSPMFWPYGVKGGGHSEGHKGWDIDAPAGIEILAAGAGVVRTARHCDDAGGTCSFGYLVRIGLADSRGVIGYHHAGPPLVEEGEDVAAGQPIATFEAYEDVPVIHFDLAMNLDKHCPEPFMSAEGREDADWYRSISTPNTDQEDPLYVDDSDNYAQLCFEL